MSNRTVLCYVASVTWWGMSLAATVAAYFTKDSQIQVWLVLPNLVLGAVAIWIIRYRARWPFRVSLVLALFTILSGSSLVVAFWALASLAKRRNPKQFVPAALVFWGVGALGIVLTSGAEGTGSKGVSVQVSGPDQVAVGQFELALFTLIYGLAIALVVAIGYSVGANSELLSSLRARAEAAEAERDLRVREAQSDERNRIAREMHDVLAHRLSLVSMHAGVLALRDDLSREETREIAGIINENTRASLVELRGVLGSLRSADDQVAPPQPTLAELPQLFDRFAELGSKVVTKVELPEGSVPPLISRHAYRIIGEALTNAHKHAPGQPVEVQVVGAPGSGVSIRCVNQLAALAVDEVSVPGAGVGLSGIRERVKICGGTMEHGVKDGDFVLEVWLPW